MEDILNPTIIKADKSHVAIIRNIANRAWPVAYKDIISAEQIEFMLDKMYNISLLEDQITTQHQFYLLVDKDDFIGFIGFEYNYMKEKITKIHKLYLLPEYKGQGHGKNLLDFVVKLNKSQQVNSIILNVNKNNPAFHFYTKYGFFIKEEVVLDIGNNFVMDDYIMQLDLNP